MTSSSLRNDNLIYFDNAATSFPKPPTVMEEMMKFMKSIGGNPSRSAHSMSVEASNIVFEARTKLAELFGVKNPMRVIMCFNATDALNLAIQGLLTEGDHAIMTSMEHNSVARPLKELEKRNKIKITVVKASNKGIVASEDIARAIIDTTKLVVVNHGSNVFGVVQQIEEIGKVCRTANVPLLVDASQTAGVIPIDVGSDNIDLLAFTGHKALGGPPGTGGLIISDNFDHSTLRPLRFGGTGSYSDKTYQPTFIPDMFESGTLNTVGIAGLLGGIDFLEKYGGIQKVYAHKKKLTKYFYNAARDNIRKIKFYIEPEICETGVVSFNIEGMEPSLVAQKLSDEYGIMARAGLHCAPMAHQTMGTFPRGTLRFSFGIFNTEKEIDRAVDALATISKG
ncbi:MAG: aminotransferase class V-fold PLP-dependent enzyme [Spirochaetes bacterium]|nr:aminotransferase class V-fold PLP-dependent enzyme [Spirochaetota bacterium]